MVLPKYTEMMNPILSTLKQGKAMDLKTILDCLKREFKPTPDELNQRIENGTPKFNHRMNWAIFDLAKARMIRRVERGVYEINEEGRRFLSKNPNFTYKDLMLIPEYKAYRRPNSKKKTLEETIIIQSEDETPLEKMEELFNEIQNNTIENLLHELKECSNSKFEEICVRLIVKMGYGGSQKETFLLLGKSHDEGLDGVINMDKLGLEKLYIQAKKWKNVTVGRDKIQQLSGAIEGKATKGLLMTTSHFSKEAKEYANQPGMKKIVLIDGNEMAKYMMEYKLGVETVNNFELKKVDKDFFEDEGDIE